MSFSSLLKMHRESSGMTQSQAAERLSVSEKTISNWETGAAHPSAEKCRGIGTVYGIDRDELFKAYNDMVWPPEEMPEDFPTCLFCENAMGHIADLSFPPQEVELMRMLEIYCTNEWDFSSLSKAYDRIRRLPYEYINRVGIAELSQMMMSICDKLQMKERDFYPDRSDYNKRGQYQGDYEENVIRDLIIERIMLPDGNGSSSEFSVFNMSLQDIVNIATEGTVFSDDHWHYYRFNERHAIQLMDLIDEGFDVICHINTEADDEENCEVEPFWDGWLGVKRDRKKKFNWDSIKEKFSNKLASVWVSANTAEEEKGQYVYKAYMTSRGKELWAFYKDHRNLFEDDTNDGSDKKEE